MVAFLLIACFGILFAGCGGPSEPTEEEFTFTEDDVARFRELVMSSASNGGVMEPHIVGEGGTSSIPVLDLSLANTYTAIRTGVESSDENLYRVTNEFVNVRSASTVTSEQVERLVRGDTMTVLDFVDAAWAHIRLRNGREGYVSTRYIAKMVSEEQLQQEKAAFEGQYFVNFGFLNVRKGADSQSELLGELPGQAIVRPISMDDVWARIPFKGKEGYVAVEYLRPFLSTFLVRQDNFALPVLHYRLDREGVTDALAQHVAALKEAGANIMTFRSFRELLLAQEDRDVRLDPRSVILAVSDITAANIRDVSDVLRASGVNATLFIQTGEIGIDGITDQVLLTLQANGHDIQSAGHTGDDLRSLTNAQVELEMKQSRQILEEKLKRPIFAIAYPLGGSNDRIENLAANAGYLIGVGSSPVRTFKRNQLLRLPSYIITSSMTNEDIVAIVRGQEP